MLSNRISAFSSSVLFIAVKNTLKLFASEFDERVGVKLT